MNQDANTPKGPLRHRVLIGLFSAILTLLFIWSLGFLISDIGNLPGPDYEAIRKQYVTQSHLDRQSELEDRLKETGRQIQEQRERQSLLQTSTNNSRETMNQLLEMHRHNLAQQVTPSTEEQQALAESEKQFLANQKEFQEANEAIALLSEETRSLEEQQRELEEEIQPLEEAAMRANSEAWERHNLLTACLKLAILLPLFFLAAWFLKTRKDSPYRVMFVASSSRLSSRCQW